MCRENDGSEEECRVREKSIRALAERSRARLRALIGESEAVP
jgi:hypothetical protein